MSDSDRLAFGTLLVIYASIDNDMLHPYLNLALALTLSSICSNSFGARGVLKTDGIFKVKGADLSVAHITVVPQGAQAFSLPLGTRNFALELPLNDLYLVNFEREGCPTKQVYFDTRVPVEYHASMFTFPFMVTLDYVYPKPVFTYEGPVGFVRYHHELHDFGYETEYVVKVEEEFRARMEQMTMTGSDPKIFLAPAAALVVNLPRGELNRPSRSDAEGTLAPNVREVPRLVHVVDQHLPETHPTREMIILLSPRASSTGYTPARPVLKSVAVAPLAYAPSDRDLPAIPVKVERTPASLPRASLAQVPDHAAPAGAPSVAIIGTRTRKEEVFQEGRRVIIVVRYTATNGTVDELRQVTHAFGGVFYFDNSRSITERDFEALTSVP